MQANPNVDDWQSTLDVCGSCFRTIQREGGLVQAPYLSNEKQLQVHALILDKQCTWREYRSKRLHDFGCHQLRFVAQLAQSHAASIAAPCSASLEQVRGRSPAEVCACVHVHWMVRPVCASTHACRSLNDICWHGCRQART